MGVVVALCWRPALCPHWPIGFWLPCLIHWERFDRFVNFISYQPPPTPPPSLPCQSACLRIYLFGCGIVQLASWCCLFTVRFECKSQKFMITRAHVVIIVANSGNGNLINITLIHSVLIETKWSERANFACHSFFFVVGDCFKCRSIDDTSYVKCTEASRNQSECEILTHTPTPPLTNMHSVTLNNTEQWAKCKYNSACLQFIHRQMSDVWIWSYWPVSDATDTAPLIAQHLCASVDQALSAQHYQHHHHHHQQHYHHGVDLIPRLSLHPQDFSCLLMDASRWTEHIGRDSFLVITANIDVIVLFESVCLLSIVIDCNAQSMPQSNLCDCRCELAGLVSVDFR